MRKRSRLERSTECSAKMSSERYCTISSIHSMGRLGGRGLEGAALISLRS
jgi:hypothetical protein